MSTTSATQFEKNEEKEALQTLAKDLLSRTDLELDKAVLTGALQEINYEHKN